MKKQCYTFDSAIKGHWPMDSIFTSIVLLLVVAVVVTAIFRYFNLPTILGYILVGVLVGPSVTGVISDNNAINQLAEFGVVFLLFTIGLEFSLPKIMAMRATVFGYGGLQVIITTAVTMLISLWLGATYQCAFILGGIVAMSSTAIVLKQLSDQFELNQPHGRNAFAILLLQDIAAILFLMYIPSLGEQTSSPWGTDLLIALLKGIFAIWLVAQIGRWILRPSFKKIASIQSTELFTLTTIVTALGLAWLTYALGLSLTLGALLAGMMLGITQFQHQINVEIRPFRDLLLGLFFTTIGLQLHASALTHSWHWVILLVLGLIIFKIVSITLLGILFKNNKIISLRTGLVLAQGSEFSFAILFLAEKYQIMPGDLAQIVSAALLVSMALSPLIIRYNEKISHLIFPRAYKLLDIKTKRDITKYSRNLQNHAIICGYGRVGQNIIRFLQEKKLNYIALDLDLTKIQNANLCGDNVVYGDATRLEILEISGIEEAAALVLCINDRSTIEKIIAQARRLSQHVPIIVRSYDDSDLDSLLKLGATEVIPETLELSLILSSHVLLWMRVPAMEVFQLIEKVRNTRYKLLHKVLPDANIFHEGSANSYKKQLYPITILPEANAIGITLKAAGLERFQVQIVALRRAGFNYAEPDLKMKIQAGDIIVLFGEIENLEAAERYLLAGE